MYTYPPPKSSSGRHFFDPSHLYPYPIIDPALAPPEVEHLGATSARLRVPFVAPRSPHLDTLLSEHADHWHITTSRTFDIFFTIPVRMLCHSRDVCDHLVIMFNGLNEILPWHSWLYDALGESLASQGIASVLLPTPFHLNRIPQRRDPGDARAPHDILRRPTATTRYYAPYLNFAQSFLELDTLLDLVAGKLPSDDTWRFYAKTFNVNTRVSLFGFSMGGLRAIAKFLGDPSDRFHKCILLSSGGKLNHLTPPDVEAPAWRSFVEQVQQVTPGELSAHGLSVHTTPDLASQLVGAFFIDNFGPLVNAVHRRGERILVIVGDRDPDLKADALSRLGQDAHVETVAGMKHVVSGDTAFELNYNQLVTRMIGFLHATGSPALSKDEIRDTLIARLHECKVPIPSLTTEDLLQHVRTDQDLIDIYLLSKGRFASDAALLDSLKRHKDKTHPGRA